MNKEEFMVSSKDFLARIEASEQARLKKPFLIRMFLNFMDFIWYRLLLRITDVPFLIKMKTQEILFGYCDSDVWNLAWFIHRKIYNPLKDFIHNYEEHGMSLPSEFAADPAAWLLILKKIEKSFDSFERDENGEEFDYVKMMSEEDKEKYYKEIEEGFTLFGKYFRDLWD